MDCYFAIFTLNGYIPREHFGMFGYIFTLNLFDCFHFASLSKRPGRCGKETCVDFMHNEPGRNWEDVFASLFTFHLLRVSSIFS